MQISFGSLAEMFGPAAFALAALLSTWVLYDARRRAHKLPRVAAWTLSTLLFPPIIFPLYLVSRIFDRRQQDSQEQEAPEPPLSGDEAAGSDDSDAPAPSAKPPRRLALPALYLLALALPGALYFYRDYQSLDAHLARASEAKLHERTERAISEYRAALSLADDPHTRKLLGLELARAGRSEEALSEFIAAERAGDPDALLPFRIASALDALGRTAEAEAAYRKFLQSQACAPESAPQRICAQARARLNDEEQK